MTTLHNPSLGGSETYNFSYDGSDEMTAALLSSTAGTVNSYGYAYDRAENRTSSQTDMNLATIGVNDLNQFTTVSGGGSMTFQGTLEDPANVTIDGDPATVNSSLVFAGTAAVTTGTNVVTISAIDPFNQTTTQQYQVTVPTVSGSYAYDANGNLTSDGVRNYVWDAANRLVQIWYRTEGSSASTTMIYDGLGRRAQIVETGSTGIVTSTNNFLWCGTEICEARDGNDDVIKRYYPQGVQISGTSYYYTRDHLGSIRELTGTSGTVLARYDYDPYGQQTETTGTMATDFGYAGYYMHQPSGLDLALFRAYSASEGRWISRDPIGEGRAVNLYGYVNNDPVDWVDPLGLSPDPPSYMDGITDPTEAQQAAVNNAKSPQDAIDAYRQWEKKTMRRGSSIKKNKGKKKCKDDDDDQPPGAPAAVPAPAPAPNPGRQGAGGNPANAALAAGGALGVAGSADIAGDIIAGAAAAALSPIGL